MRGMAACNRLPIMTVLRVLIFTFVVRRPNFLTTGPCLAVTRTVLLLIKQGALLDILEQASAILLPALRTDRVWVPRRTLTFPPLNILPMSPVTLRLPWGTNWPFFLRRAIPSLNLVHTEVNLSLTHFLFMTTRRRGSMPKLKRAASAHIPRSLPTLLTVGTTGAEFAPTKTLPFRSLTLFLGSVIPTTPVEMKEFLFAQIAIPGCPSNSLQPPPSKKDASSPPWLTVRPHKPVRPGQLLRQSKVVTLVLRMSAPAGT